MAVDIIHDRAAEMAVMYCTTTDRAFGPVFTGPGCAEDAEDFLYWVRHNPGPVEDRLTPAAALFTGCTGTDPRDYTSVGLERLYQRWTQASDRYRGVEA